MVTMVTISRSCIVGLVARCGTRTTNSLRKTWGNLRRQAGQVRGTWRNASWCQTKDGPSRGEFERQQYQSKLPESLSKRAVLGFNWMLWASEMLYYMLAICVESLTLLSQGHKCQCLGVQGLLCFHKCILQLYHFVPRINKIDLINTTMKRSLDLDWDWRAMLRMTQSWHVFKTSHSTSLRLWNAKAVGNTKRGPPTTAQTTMSALAELDTKIISHFCALNGHYRPSKKKQLFFFRPKFST